MKDLYQAVKRHLGAKADSKAAVALWTKLVTVYEKEGSDSLENMLSELAVYPDDDEGN